MSSSEAEDWECPLCMEELDVDDRGFFPCECGYQICRFCHNRLSEDYGGRCPACRRLYSEQTPRWKPISPAQVAKLKNEKKAKEREKREIESNSRRHLANVRVVQKNLVYVIGLPSGLATEEVLRSHDYFGQFGRINKIVVNRRQGGSHASNPTVGVYVTYASRDDATRAINAVDGSMLEGRVLRATFGTTKYCSYYLRNIQCQNPGCMYLHEPGEEADSFTKEDLAANRVGVRENGRHDDDDESTGLRAASQSPNTHHHGSGGVGSGRAAASSGTTSNFHNRPTSTAPGGSGAPTSSARGRKSSEMAGNGGGRPQSVDPHGNGDGHTGSALPATASWASRAMAKKTADSSEPKPRKSDPGGGTMTLRMVPSRSKAGGAKGAASGPSGARDRTKSVPAAQVDAAAGSQQQHHPVLQQMSRERKQQLRHQNRAQQKAAEAAEANDSEQAAAVGPTKQGGRAKKAADWAGQQSSPRKSKSEAKGKQPAVAKPETEVEAEVGTEAKAESEPVDSSAVPDSADQPLAASASPEAAPAEPIAEPLSGEPVEQATEAAAAVSRLSSAQTFKSLTDSLCAKLDAKGMPTGEPSSGLRSDSGRLAYGEAPLLGGGSGGGGAHEGLRAPGHPFASVDPLLFPSSAGGEMAPPVAAGTPGSGLLGGSPLDAPSPFSLLSGQAAAIGPQPEWASRGPYAPSTASLLMDPGVLRDHPGSSAAPGGTSRRRSRWDFAHVDEASAQAELQSVLGRSIPAIGQTQQQQQQQQQVPQSLYGAQSASLVSSRDLGLFSTPVRNGYNGSGLWDGMQPQQHQQHGAVPAPFPPPGFGRKQSSESSQMARLAAGASPTAGTFAENAQGTGAGSSALLTRLMGHSAMGGLDGANNAHQQRSVVDYPQQQQQQQMLHDPAILQSQLSPAIRAGLSAGHQLGDQLGQGSADPNALNSLLARFQLGRAEGETPSLSTEGSYAARFEQVAMAEAAAAKNNTQQDGLVGPPGITPFSGALSEQQAVSPSQSQAPPSAASTGFMDPAIMNVGRLSLSGRQSAAATAPASGCASPTSAQPPGLVKSPGRSAVGAQNPHGPPGPPPGMLSRSANSSGRSRFLNHFSSDGDGYSQARGDAAYNGQSASATAGAPPGLPSTGVFGELLRRAKQDSMLPNIVPLSQPLAAGPGTGTCYDRAYTGGAYTSGAYISGKSMLSDIELKLETARREAQELQAQLSTVIGQNQSAMWALANGGGGGSGTHSEAAAAASRDGRQ